MSQKNTYRVLTLLAIVAILLTGCGGSKKTLKDQLIGKWDCVDPSITDGSNSTVTFEFMSGGKAKLSMASITVDITYTWTTDTQIEITIDMGALGGQPTTQVMDVSISGNNLSLTAEGTTAQCTKK
jgi:hypothetical protein